MKQTLCSTDGCPFKGRYCRVHLTPKAPKVTEIEKESEKRKKETRQYQKLRKEYMEANPVCEFPKCKQKSVDIHHKGGRTGDKLLDVDLFMALCREHHTIIEINPAWAKQNGFSVSRLANTK